MDKYGVDTETDSGTVKKGSADETCPLCGKPLDTAANVKRCPEHGTAPFEKTGPATK